MRVTLISPRLVVQKGDFLGSGIPYWPIELATFAAKVRETGDEVAVLDLFGSAPQHLTEAGDHYLQGVPLSEYAETPAINSAEVFVVFAISYMSHSEIMSILRELRSRRPTAMLAVLENSQAVTAYSLQRLCEPLFLAGAEALICGEPYFNWQEIRSYLAAPKINNVPHNVMTNSRRRKPERKIVKHAYYPVPAWELFPLRGYWSLPYAHGPKTSRFLPILTSRGCPYPCDFCVVPETNNRRWRGNAAAAVVDEIITLRDRFGVRDFHIEDLNPTVDHERWEEICRLLINRRANIRFYIVSGTKAETVHLDQVPLLAEAGCRYLSISPESGSKTVMKAIGKPFDYGHGLKLIAACSRHGIRTQACFLVGHPAETEADASASGDYLRALVRTGLDEVAVFIVAAFAGSALYSKSAIAVADRNAVPSFSPKGRHDYDDLERRRRNLIRLFLWEKMRRGPDLWLQGFRALFSIPETKMENLPRRVAYVMWLITRARIRAVCRMWR